MIFIKMFFKFICILNFCPHKGLADLVNAETELQRSQALSQMEGALSSVYKEWRRLIIKCLANIEAYIDFSEDENVEENILQESNNMKDIKT